MSRCINWLNNIMIIGDDVAYKLVIQKNDISNVRGTNSIWPNMLTDVHGHNSLSTVSEQGNEQMYLEWTASKYSQIASSTCISRITLKYLKLVGCRQQHDTIFDYLLHVYLYFLL